MRKALICFLLASVVSTAMAQTAKEEISKNLRLSAGSLMAYMEPQGHLTSPPAGMTPFYISHVGRSGSCYLADSADYAYPYMTLLRADSLGQLTPLGRDVLQRLLTVRRDADCRYGELTVLGAEQNRHIANRMYQRFPEVFTNGTHVDARSIADIPCILSMENALQQLLTRNSKLEITHTASRRDMYYMEGGDTLSAVVAELDSNAVFADFSRRHDQSASLLAKLFSGGDYVSQAVDPARFCRSYFRLVSSIQNTELRKRLSLYDTFTDEELYHCWLCENSRAYVRFGASPLSGGRQPFTQCNLLRRIIAEADSMISLGRPGLSLRYGHESAVASLACLLALNRFGQQLDDFGQLDRREWRNYRLSPMAANVQFVFYRTGTNSTDIVFKVLLNEDEVTLPLKTNMAPYYRWKDFKEYCRLLLGDFGQ